MVDLPPTDLSKPLSSKELEKDARKAHVNFDEASERVSDSHFPASESDMAADEEGKTNPVMPLTISSPD